MKYSKEEALKLFDEIGVKKAAQQLGIQYYTLSDCRSKWSAAIGHFCIACIIKWLMAFFVSSLMVYFDKPLYWRGIGRIIPRSYSSGFTSVRFCSF